VVNRYQPLVPGIPRIHHTNRAILRLRLLFAHVTFADGEGSWDHYVGDPWLPTISHVFVAAFLGHGKSEI
jgi:hypothetical protein